MSESRKFYNKGVKNFHKGDLDKAITNLNLAISHDMKNSAALNLRGIIYYIKGETSKALTSWNINVEFNDDEIAKGHISSFEQDKDYLCKYNDAFKAIKIRKFHEAINLLEEATKTEFNILNVRNTLAYCYIKEGQYEEAKKNIEIVLEKHITNELVKDNIDILKNVAGISVRRGNNKKIYAGILAAAILLTIGATAMNNDKKIPVLDDNLATINTNEGKEVEGNEKKEEKNKEEAVKDKEILNAKALKDATLNKDFMFIGQTLKTANLQGLSELELDVINDAKALMKSEGISKLYKEGTNEFNTKNFGKAKDKFLIALDYSKDTYLDAHITYMLSVALENLDEIDEAIKYYSKYESTRYEEQGSYKEEVLYKLAILNDKKDKEESKKFASKLRREYPNSIYNNDNIKAILNN